MLLALVVIGLLMVISGHDAVLVAVIVVGAGAFAIVAAKLVADSILRDVESVRDGLTAVGRGEREVHIEPPPPVTSSPSWPWPPTR